MDMSYKRNETNDMSYNKSNYIKRTITDANTTSFKVIEME